MEVVADPSMDRYGGTDSGLAGRPESLISARAGLGLDSITEFPSSKPFREALQHNPKQANALAGLASALKASDPAAAAEAFAAASTADEAAVSSALQEPSRSLPGAV